MVTYYVFFYRYEPIGTEEGPMPKTRDGYESLKVRRSILFTSRRRHWLISLYARR